MMNTVIEATTKDRDDNILDVFAMDQMDGNYHVTWTFRDTGQIKYESLICENSISKWLKEGTWVDKNAEPSKPETVPSLFISVCYAGVLYEANNFDDAATLLELLEGKEDLEGRLAKFEA